jgi:PAS domain S-box-containing protein
MSDAPAARYDPAECEAEPIETPDAIQPNGALIAALAEFPHMITHASENLADFLGQPAPDVLGQPLAAILGEGASQALAESALRQQRYNHTLRLPAGASLYATAHQTGRYICIDIERLDAPSDVDLPVSRALAVIEPFRHATSIEDVMDRAAEALKLLGGYDRVLAYKFDAAWNGQAVAERRAPHLEPYLGLYFPAAHVPARSRLVYQRQRVIAVADTHYTPVALRRHAAAQGEPLDLTRSAFRSISPRHLDYLRNMDIRASLTIALARGPNLLGMLLCHHGVPRIAGPELRAAAYLVGHAASLMFDSVREAGFAKRRLARENTLKRLAKQFVLYPDSGDALHAAQADLLGLMQASGAVVWCSDARISLGDVPPAHVADAIRDAMYGAHQQEPVAREDLGVRGSPFAAHADVASGALLATIGGEVAMVIWFRPEHARTIFWGGNAPTRQLIGLDPVTPTPTRETIRGHCLPWTDDDLATAAAIATALNDGMTRRLTERVRHEMERRLEQDEALREAVSALRERQRQLETAERRLEQAQSIAGVGTWHYDAGTENLLWSKEMYRLSGMDPNDINPDFERALSTHPEDRAARDKWWHELRSGKRMAAHEERLVRPDGEERLVRYEGGAETDAEGKVAFIAGTFQDVTERRQLELRLAHAQKMESLGYLTGGMAHDFNNMLGVILVNLELLQRYTRADPKAAELCAEAIGGAHRCADLVRSLLAYARRQPLRPENVDINQLVADLMRLLQRTIGEAIEVVTRLQPDLWPATVDAAQLESAIVNLATNARDAMPRGGRLTISTRNVKLDALAAAQQLELDAGDYVLIEVTDSGTGIPPEIINRIFDPFFTTKAHGAGTGLGLSMVFGFAKQSGGHLSVYSEPGLGATFRIYLPRAAVASANMSDRPGEDAAAAAPSATILLVEDNADLRRAVSRQLKDLGYTVLEAADASAALSLLTRGTQVDLLFTDMVMPGPMNGLELAGRATEVRADLAVLLTSGYSAEPADLNGKLPWHLLNKPYSRDKLHEAIGMALASSGGNRRAGSKIESETDSGMPGAA